MDREEKVKGQERKRGELMGEKLKRGILFGKREGNSTPSHTWKFGVIQPDGTLIQDPTNSKNILSARNLGASLWEMHPQLNNLRVEEIGKNGRNLSHHKQDNILEAQAQSPSKQVAPYRPSISPNTSLVLNRKSGESSHGLKTSTELLKVLNRIWSLEEKHALDMSLVKTLRTELGQSQAQIQELLQDKKRDQNEINNLTEQITELKVVRKKDQDRIKDDAVKLVEEKLENEVKLRRHSEKRHHKLAKELSEMKISFSNAFRELEREKKARALLEDLCDEFAKGIRDYEQEVRFMKQKSTGVQIVREGNDRFILHISEAWLDERTQMKLADTQNISEKQSPLDKLCFEIEAFLREKQSGKNDCTPSKNPCGSSHSLDTFHLNEPASAPWKANEEDDSVGIISSRSLKQANAFAGRKGYFGNFTSDGSVKKTAKPESTKSRTDDLYETNNPRMSRKGDTMQRSSREGMNSITGGNLDLQDIIRNSSFNFIEGSFDPSMFTGSSSPVKKCVSKVSAADPEICESSSSRCWAKKGITKPNTLKAKLIEARLEGKQSRARTSRSLSKG